MHEVKQEKIDAFCNLGIKQAKDTTKTGGMLPGDHEIKMVTVITGLLKECPDFSHQKLLAEIMQQNFLHKELKWSSSVFIGNTS